MRSEFNADAAQHKQPKHHHQRKVKSAEAGGIELREGKVKRATGSQQPDFVPVPYRTNRAQHHATLRATPRHEKADHTRAEIETVEHYVRGHHHRHDHEPERFHRSSNSIRLMLKGHGRGRSVVNLTMNQEQEKNPKHQVYAHESQQREHAVSS